MEWMNAYPHSLVDVLPISASDHAPLILTTNPPIMIGRKPFRFELMWLDFKEGRSIIENAWQKHAVGSRAYRVVQKLKETGKELREWNKSRVGNIQQRIRDSEANLLNIQSNIHTTRDFQRELSERKQLDFYRKCEQTMWAQRAKQLWLQQGDSNSRYFHAVVNMRRKHNRISGIMNSNGTWTTNQEEIKNLSTQYFQSLFQHSATTDKTIIRQYIHNAALTTLTEDQIQFLNNPFTKLEIENAVFQMEGSKSPGPDGFPAKFFQELWPTVADDNQGRIKGIKVGRSAPPINHLFFADDSMIFFKANIDSCKSITDIWKDFGMMSGLCINKDKTEVKFSPNTPRRFQKLLSEILDCRTTDRFQKYLGAKIDASGRERIQFQAIYNSLKERLQVWKGKLLSQAGRLVLIKSVLSSLSTYQLSYYRLTKSEATKCDQILAHFFWGSDRSPNRPHMINWDKVCQPLHLGGLGVKKFEDFNQALVAKQIWRICTDDSTLLSRVMKAKYGETNSVLGFKCPNSASKQWKDIFSAKDLIVNNLQWQVGTGDRIDLNNPAWPRPRQINSDGPQRVSDLIDENHHWRVNVIRAIYNRQEANNILKMTISTRGTPDQLVWTPNAQGVYKVKDGYNQLNHSEHPVTPISPFKDWKAFWKLKLPHKVLMFGWKLCHNRLPIADNLLKRNFKIQGNCGFGCDSHETQNHLFKYCPMARAVWFGAHYNIRIESIPHDSIQEWLQHLISSHNSNGEVSNLDHHELIHHIITICWCIYGARNETIFQHKSVSPEQVILDCAYWENSWHLHLTKENTETLQRNRFFTENQDLNSYHHQHIGPTIVLHWKKDRRRNLRLWSSFVYIGDNHFTPIVGKVTTSSEDLVEITLKGMRDTLQLLRNQYIDHLVLGANNRNLINKLKSPPHHHLRWGTVARDVKDLTKTFRSITFTIFNDAIHAPISYLDRA
ncbi:uncharacterized protein G2W53_014655 [Senna tora]|uniref:Reverse transcriptase zinc-binding domain-containing protein n=1 Tax=Senna tora TaxID=362788 RepID=A0A835C8F1_9FABA|nr:uncharacterized protein G2W53_014655 [Senna tora]